MERRAPASVVSRSVDARLRVADAISEPRDLAVAALLYQDALRIAGSAVAPGGEASLDPIDFDALPADDLIATTNALRARARERARTLRPPGLLANKRARWSCAAAGAVLLTVGAVLRFQPFSGHDLALGKPVTASSTLAPYLLSALVDGKRGSYDTVGAHTVPGMPNAWIQVDLEEFTPISRIVICNRGDRSMDDGLPFTLELSSDGTTYRQITSRTTHFGDGSFGSPPWTVRIETSARYVRVRSKTFIALSELEVY